MATKKSPGPLTKFSEEAWYALADHDTVHADGRISITFRNGMELKTGNPILCREMVR